MKRLFLSLMLMVFILLSCHKQQSLPDEQGPQQLKTPAQIDAFIKEELRLKGYFDWNTSPEDIVWSALQQSDKIMSVGYKPALAENIERNIHQIDINTVQWKQVKNQLLNMILEEEQKLHPSIRLSDLEMYPEYILPVIDVKIENFSTFKKLRASHLVRYAEPMGYEPKLLAATGRVNSSSGCGSNVAEPGLIAGVDYTTIAPTTKMSWNYPYHGIPSAWTKATGAGIKIFVIDSGTSPDQDNLGAAFNQGLSSGRTIEKIVTLPRSTFLGIPTGPVETPADGCGHGTAMAGVAAAPRGTDGNAVGVAYNCNLVTCRAAADVYLDESREVKGVSDAYTNAANRADVRIISMSMGKLTSSSQMSDAIKYAYGKGKLIFCAGGTSFDWTAGLVGVIFPATMNEVNAVTGIKDDLINRCDACHQGSQIDFVVVMEKSSNGRHPLSLAMNGDAPSTVGGSSVATATAAGMAALVWSKYPSWTRDQVLNRLISSSSYYPTRNANFGWGRINADAATN